MKDMDGFELGIYYIVVWTTRDDARDHYEHHWKPCETYFEAVEVYKEVLLDRMTHTASITFVAESTDYATHPMIDAAKRVFEGRDPIPYDQW
jgi:hypothetical protein